MALQDSTVILSVSARHLVRDYVFGGSGSLIRQGHLGKSREGWHGNLEAMRPWGSPGQGLEECEIGWCAGVRWVTLHDATLTVSNDESPYFHSSPLPHPVAVPEACRLGNKVKPSSTAPAPPLAPLPLNGGPHG
ncbi:hypothetical protein T05_10743 [Trichinella murrelli]|uniref:Uncharacterized protein n=1 Tax=Trichinella murrelli TaxID=144512 RepID=A0A0V0T6A8_9BILA|nr:hypothetical protein T05_10743 [Trichinella murrelli]